MIKEGAKKQGKKGKKMCLLYVLISYSVILPETKFKFKNKQLLSEYIYILPYAI